MEPAEPRPRSYTLQRAAAVVFAFVTVLPMLLYLNTLSLLGALGRTLDRSVLHALAHDSVRELLEHMASRLQYPAHAA